MNLPNKLSLGRIILAPVFYALHGIGQTFPFLAPYLWPLLVILFLWAEISDVLDGQIARKQGLVSDIGKILDPFSDVVTHLTYFFVFYQSGVLWGWMFMVFTFRELGIILIRMVLISRGTALAASSGGKLKSLFYAIGSGTALAAVGNQWLGILPPAQPWLVWGARALVGGGLVLSVTSFAAYLRGFLALRPKAS